MTKIKVHHWQTLSSPKQLLSGKSKPLLILGSRQISAERVQQLTKQLITKRPVVWGCVTEQYITGLEDCAQFQTLSLAELTLALEKIKLTKNQQLTILQYSQADTVKAIKRLPWSGVIGVNGSWHRAFHYRDEYHLIKKLHLPYKLVSSFVDETEARQYLEQIKPKLVSLKKSVNQKFSVKELLELATQAGKHSFDYTFQAGAVLAKNGRLLLWAHNAVVPYETYMLHAGASKEKKLTPPQDLNHFDTNHAEVELMLKALEQKLDLTDCSLFIKLMPCPICARMLARTPLKKIVCQLEHSQGYAKKILGDRLDLLRN